MKWTEKLSVGNEKIDNQHRMLIETVEKNIEACDQGRGKEEILNTLDFLADYVKTHFRDEEQYMLDNKFTKLEQHKSVHDQFLNEIMSIITEVNSDGVSLSIINNVNIKLEDWIYNHIMLMDKQFHHFINGIHE